MKTLKIIQTLAKIGKVLSKIVYICCIVGAVGCLAGIVSLAVGQETLKLGGVTLHTLLKDEAGIELGTIWASIIVGLFLCVGEITVAKLAENYFSHELKAGTPFTTEGAKELLRLGIYTAAVSVLSVILAKIAQNIICLLAENVEPLSIGSGENVGLGITFIVIALLCRYGAELKESSDV